KGLSPSPNDIWLNYVAQTRDEYESIRQLEALCSGTIAGQAETVLAVMHRMYDLALTVDQVWGIDQGIYNYIARTAFADVLRVPRMSEGFIATCSAFRTASFNSAV